MWLRAGSGSGWYRRMWFCGVRMWFCAERMWHRGKQMQLRVENAYLYEENDYDGLKDGLKDGRTDGRTDGQSLLMRCDYSSKKDTFLHFFFSEVVSEIQNLFVKCCSLLT